MWIWLQLRLASAALTKITTRQALTATKSITNSLFYQIQASGSGIVHIATASTTLTLTNCGIYQCTNSATYGILYITTLATCSISRVCAYSCTCKNSWEMYFASIATSNTIDQLAVVSCTSTSGGILTEKNKASTFKNMNVSYNRVAGGGASGLCFGNGDSSSKVQTSNFFNTTGRDVLILDPQTIGFNLSKINIVDCGGAVSGSHMIRLWGKYTIEDGAFVNNKFDYFFSVQQSGSTKQSLTLVRCVFSKSHVTKTLSNGYSATWAFSGTFTASPSTLQLAGNNPSYHVLAGCNVPTDLFSVVDIYNAYGNRADRAFRLSTFLYCFTESV